MIITPPFLRPGDTIALTCPAGFMSRDRAQTCIDALQHWGYRLRIGATVGGASADYFSGTDKQRLGELQHLLDDPAVGAILCGRGGYGLSRIIDDIDFTGFIRKPKWIIGYSDVTLLLNHVTGKYVISTLHAPMAGAFYEYGADSYGVLSLRDALTGGPVVHTCPPHPLNRNGRAMGPLAGGNLALLAHLIGSPSDFDTRGKILFLEDVGEYLYNIDRMLRQLKRSGRLEGLAGLVVGSFTELKDTVRPFGSTVEEIVLDVVKEYDYPLCFGFPVGHGKDNVALRLGMAYTLDVGEQTILRG
jgi:muramoyltetrapeptide carboxypeptidase